MDNQSEKRVLLQVENLSVAYGKKRVLDQINCSVKAGEIVGIVGQSGSGKSTLLRTVMGLPGAQIREGQILYDGTCISEWKGEPLRKIRGNHMGMVFQNSKDSFCPSRTMGDQIIESVRAHGKKGEKEIYKEACGYMAEFDLKDEQRVWNSYPYALSGGMAQRMGIITALLLEPDLLLADEPTAAIDTKGRRKVLERLQLLCLEKNMAMLFVTHHMVELAYVANKVIVMKEGRIVEVGSCKQVIENPSHVYTKELMDAVPKLKRSI